MLDQPKRLRAKLLPYDHLADGEKMIAELAGAGFLIRYSVDGQSLLQIENFAEHQSFHPRETSAGWPGPAEHYEQLPVVCGGGDEPESRCLAGDKPVTSRCLAGDVPVVTEIKRDLKRSKDPKDQEKGQTPKTQARREPQAPAYTLPDRGGNERKPLEDFPTVFVSEVEKAGLLDLLTLRGVRPEHHSHAFFTVHDWFLNSPAGRKAYRDSSDHAARIRKFGIAEALKEQASVDNAKAAAARAAGPKGFGKSNAEAVQAANNEFVRRMREEEFGSQKEEPIDVTPKGGSHD